MGSRCQPSLSGMNGQVQSDALLAMAGIMPAMRTDSDIWGRIIEFSWRELDPRMARAILKMGLMQADQRRLERLARRGREGKLSSPEQAELNNYVHVARVLAMMHSRARKFLKDEGTRPSRQKVP